MCCWARNLITKTFTFMMFLCKTMVLMKFDTEVFRTLRSCLLLFIHNPESYVVSGDFTIFPLRVRCHSVNTSPFELSATNSFISMSVYHCD